MLRSSSIILLSGGLDSLAALHWASEASDPMLAITFDYGQRSREREIETAAKICRHYDLKHRVIELPWYSSMAGLSLVDSRQLVPTLAAGDLDNPAVTQKSAKAVWVPNRNGVFIHVAASIAEQMLANWIVVGFNAEEGRTFPDNTEEFRQTVNRSLKFSTAEGVEVVAPMGEKTKTEIVLWAKEKQVPLGNLWSCYRGDDRMCGECESCLRLMRALREGGATECLEKLF